MNSLETLIKVVRTTTIILTSFVVQQQCSTYSQIISNPPISDLYTPEKKVNNKLKNESKNEVHSPENKENEHYLPQLTNDSCGIYDALSPKLFLLMFDRDHYDSRLALIIHPGSIETRTHRINGSSGHIGYDFSNGLYFRDESTQEQSFFKDGYVPNGDLMACDLKEKIIQFQFE